MFKFTKSETDLGKLAWPTQYKILCDWLRNIDTKQNRLARQTETVILDLAKLYDYLHDLDSQSGSPSGESVVHPDDV